MLMLSIKAAQPSIVNTYWQSSIIAVLKAEINSIIAVYTRLQTTMPGAAYANNRADVLNNANNLCKAQKNTISSLGGGLVGNANTCN
ncbi:hypothetical protein TWF506_005531 [Arthrobotrys conoides]|uniref:Uncharacterized protein n=1 Tax=Arthrobotrys conoides TaxID=74498 RepID=A0AAN8NTS6_9PEZI